MIDSTDSGENDIRGIYPAQTSCDSSGRGETRIASGHFRRGYGDDPVPKAIEVVSPHLEHLATLLKECRSIVGKTVGVADSVTKLHLYDISSAVESLYE